MNHKSPCRLYSRFRAAALSIGLLLLIFGALSASADYIEVRRNSNLYTDPASDSPKIVRLAPGTTLDLLDEGRQENGYYRVVLPSGDEGWVYRTLVRRFPGPPPREEGAPEVSRPEGDRFEIRSEAAPPAADGREDDLVIGSWNIKWFGQRDAEDYDYVTLADFIEECDLVAIQEIRGENRYECLGLLLAELNARGHTYQYKISPETGYANNADHRKKSYTEQFAFIWDTSRLRLVSAPTLADSPAINHPVFRQVPFVGDFETVGANGFDFRVLTTHTVYNAKINFVRGEEIQWICDWMTAPHPDGETNLIAIGDFNANPSNQTSGHYFREHIPDGSRFRVLMYESIESGDIPIRTTVPTRDSSPNPFYHQQPVYDHILVTHDTTPALPAYPMTFRGQLLGVYDFDNDPWWSENGWSRGEVISAVSDHRPIWFKMDYWAEDTD